MKLGITSAITFNNTTEDDVAVRALLSTANLVYPNFYKATSKQKLVMLETLTEDLLMFFTVVDLTILDDSEPLEKGSSRDSVAKSTQVLEPIGEWPYQPG